MAGHWLDLQLEGTKSNRDGMGARNEVQTPSGTQSNHMTSSVGYASSSYGPVHFGLGADAAAESVVIHWPSGSCRRSKTCPATASVEGEGSAVKWGLHRARPAAACGPRNRGDRRGFEHQAPPWASAI